VCGRVNLNVSGSANYSPRGILHQNQRRRGEAKIQSD